MKKILMLFMIAVLAVGAVACGNNSSGQGDSSGPVEGSLQEIMDKVYAGVQQELPEMMETVLEADNMVYFLGSDKIDLVEGLASEPMMSSIAHSVVLLRLKEGAEVDAIMETIRTSVDPRKWICVGVEEDQVIVDNIENLVILIMDEEAGTFHESFLKLSE